MTLYYYYLIFFIFNLYYKRGVSCTKATREAGKFIQVYKYSFCMLRRFQVPKEDMEYLGELYVYIYSNCITKEDSTEVIYI